jgi:DeoR/GlpR family transcriptional regulator of sugar metabolism
MRVSKDLIQRRRDRLAGLLRSGGYLPVGEVCKRLGVSEATARRDLAALESQQKITRTYGGALVDFNLRFPSFSERKSEAAAGKRKMAARAHSFLRAGMVCYLDTGTTIAALAEHLCENPIQNLEIYTSSLPVSEVLAQTEWASVSLLGGQVLARQSILLGELAVRAAEILRFDIAFLSAEAINASGVWNSQESVVKLQQTVMRQSQRSILCVDSRKIGKTAPWLLTAWGEARFELLTNAGSAALRKAGIDLDVIEAIGC